MAKKKASKKQSSSALSSLAAKILAGYQATIDEIKELAGSVLSQDETKGQKKAPKKKAKKKKAAKKKKK